MISCKLLEIRERMREHVTLDDKIQKNLIVSLNFFLYFTIVVPNIRLYLYDNNDIKRTYYYYTRIESNALRFYFSIPAFICLGLPSRIAITKAI